MAYSDQDSNLFLRSSDVVDWGNSHDLPDIPIIDLASNAPLELPETPVDAALEDAQPAAMPPTGLRSGQLWLNGDVLMCACPDCGAPMSIRFWLMIADCWKCDASIELSEEQEREARRLLAERDALPPRPAAPTSPPQEARRAEKTGQPKTSGQQSGSAKKESLPPPHSQPRSPTPPPAPALPKQRLRDKPHAQPRRTRVQSRQPSGQAPPRTAAQARLQSRLQRSAQATGVSAMVNDLFGCTPAWLVSLILHIVMLTLLALFTFGDQDDGPFITLSTTVSKDVQEGGDTVVVDPLNEIHFDMPVPRDKDLTDPKQRESVVRANQDALELQLDPNIDEPSLPNVREVKHLIGTTTGGGAALAARDPRIRVEVVKREGGTTLTEAAVSRGLRWLAKHRNPNGSWSLHRFDHSPGCTCTGRGVNSDAAGTSLALLPFLGAGQTHLVGRYRKAVSGGLGWLIQHQRDDGDLRSNRSGNTGMYAHGQATIVLCEAYLMTGDEKLRDPAQRALNFIVEAQHVGGGWRYRPGDPGDTSVVGWQVMALQSGRAAKLEVPEITMELASHYLDSASSRSGALYAYQPGHGPTKVMTAEGLLCRMYLGWKADDPGLRNGVEYLRQDHLPTMDAPNIYYWYYGTQAFHHYGGSAWTEWNDRMREILVNSQKEKGHEAGSWNVWPNDQHAKSGGRLYVTALATCSLEVYYRHLPIFRQLDLD
ncbi:MAG: hypothetical protein CMJ64_09840 [Planctomycetaceae bacterium]|nr:hypothetical protein [Planctomycetaceae bacterium]